MQSSQPVTRRLARLSVLALCLAAGPWGSSSAAGRSASGPDTRVTTAARARSARMTSVLGAAWNADNSPIPEAKLRLRNVTSGRIEATTIADTSGRFTFSNVEGGTYVVELVNESGRVLTVGHPFVVGPGETAATFVRLAAHVPWFAGFFENAAGATISSAASMGVTALAPIAPPVSAKR